MPEAAKGEERPEYPPSVFFWRQNHKLGNFGDALTLVLQRRLFSDKCKFAAGELHLIGSVITENRITGVLTSAKTDGNESCKPIFWGCGKKTGLPLADHLHAPCTFLGVRGVGSRDALNLPMDTPLGDTALLLPSIYTPQPCAATTGKVLWIPHFFSRDPGPDDLIGCPDHVVMRPSIPNTVEACEAFIDAIASARFVMANAMHAAVVALAYGVPFAFWSGSQIDHPFKWRDFTSGLGFELGFSQTYNDGVTMYDAVRPDRFMAQKDMSALLSVAPFELRV